MSQMKGFQIEHIEESGASFKCSDSVSPHSFGVGKSNGQRKSDTSGYSSASDKLPTSHGHQNTSPRSSYDDHPFSENSDVFDLDCVSATGTIGAKHLTRSSLPATTGQTIADQSLNERLFAVEKKLAFVPKLYEEIASLKDRVSFLETDLSSLKSDSELASSQCQLAREQILVKRDIELLQNHNVESGSKQSNLSFDKKKSTDTSNDCSQKSSQFEDTSRISQEDCIKAATFHSQSVEGERSCYTKHEGSLNVAISIERSLRRHKKCLSQLMIVEPSSPIDESTMLHILNDNLPAVKMECKELYAKLQDYLQTRHPDLELAASLEDALDEANDWYSEMKRLYFNKGLYRKSQSSKLYGDLPRFSHESSVDVLEFIRRFENISSDFEIPAEKAELFFNNYLSESLQEEMEVIREDYQKMKSTLIHRYGNIEILTDQILAPIFVLQKPTLDSDQKSKVNYYRKLQAALHKISKLLVNQAVQKEEAETFVHGHTFLKRLLTLLPEQAYDYYAEAMLSLNLDKIRVQGKIAFELVLSTVARYYELSEFIVRNSVQVTESVKHDFTETINEETEVSTEPDSSQNGKPYRRQKTKKSKAVSSQSYPCTLPGHEHNIWKCSEFFALSPWQRAVQRKNFKHRHCFLCLKSSKECTGRKCANIDNVPKALICSQCFQNAKNKKGPCHSVLYCYCKDHKKSSSESVLEALVDYVPGFDAMILKGQINLASG